MRLRFLKPASSLPVFFLLHALHAAPAQSAPPQTTLSVNARLITLPVVVRDTKGKLVSGLTKDDFTLTEDGRAETIRYFSLDTDLPLTLALAVDTSGSVRDALAAEQSASRSFLDSMLTQSNDKAALLHFDREVELLDDLTTDKRKLNEGLNGLGPTTDTSSSTDSTSGERRHRGGTQLYDAVYLAGNEILGQRKGRQAVIVLSDGQDRGSKETLQGAIEAAQKAETEVYTIYFKGAQGHSGGFGNPGDNPGGSGRRGGIGFPGGGYPGGGYPGGGGRYPGGGGGGRGGSDGQRPESEPQVDGKKIMQQLAGETGGRFFEAKKKENFNAIYKEIADELRQQYLLGYTPDAGSTGDGFHRIALTVKKPNLFVQTRAGYYGTVMNGAKN